jgi:hypothetical protein
LDYVRNCLFTSKKIASKNSISFFASLSLVLYAVLDLAVGFGAAEEYLDYEVRLFLGLGCLLSFINMLRYLEFDPQCMVGEKK